MILVIFFFFFRWRLCRVSTIIAEGRDDDIVDPDHGANIAAKIEKLQKMGATRAAHPNLVKVPKCPPVDAASWTDNLSGLPCLTFRTLYKHFAERSAEKDVELGEWSVMDITEDSDSETAGYTADAEVTSSEASAKAPPGVKFRSFRGLDKGYRFFRDGHVQKIRLNLDVPSDGNTSLCYVDCLVLPSMRKDRIYRVRLCAAVPVNERLSTDVHAAYCICPAGLAGSCNHIAALLYALEDFVRSGLREEAAKSCTEKLKAWNRPRAQKVKPREVSKVFLRKEELSKQGSKRLKIEKPHYDPWPMCNRLVVVEEVQGFVHNLSQAHIELEKINPIPKSNNMAAHRS